MSKILHQIEQHGGLSAVHVTPVTDEDGGVVGWQNVLMCKDGTKVYPTLQQQKALMA